ncbi:MAG TPA: hypothetical protein VK783_02155 [Bacteroidia bacterium]|nr:hypothetical protein [Bacteroidia bacterium]
MKLPIYLAAFLLIGKMATAQDTIVQTDGTRIIAVVQEVGTSEIKYKKFANKETSPVYDIEKYKVASIHYADGTKDIFPATAPPAPAPTVSYIAPGAYATDPGTVATPISNISGATMYLGALVSPVSPYDGAAINNYWTNRFADEGPGTTKLNTGFTQMYNFFMGGSLIFNKQNNWTYEFQFETMSSNAIHDTSSFADGASGNLSVSYFSLNDALQYLRGTDTSNRLQIGAELSWDIGIISGTEHDVFVNNYGYQNNSSFDYDAMQMGWHLAAVAKYFVGKSKNLGFEAKLGYRSMKVNSGNEFGDDASNSGAPINFSGAMFSLGLVVQFKAHATVCVNGYEYYNGY